jgi:hypothetical protein
MADLRRVNGRENVLADQLPGAEQRNLGLRTECHTNADSVCALAYGICLDAEKPTAYRLLDSTTCR